MRIYTAGVERDLWDVTGSRSRGAQNDWVTDRRADNGRIMAANTTECAGGAVAGWPTQLMEIDEN